MKTLTEKERIAKIEQDTGRPFQHVTSIEEALEIMSDPETQDEERRWQAIADQHGMTYEELHELYVHTFFVNGTFDPESQSWVGEVKIFGEEHKAIFDDLVQAGFLEEIDDTEGGAQ